MPKLNPKSIPKSMSADEFNIYFSNVGSNIDNNFKDTDLPEWKGDSLKNTFVFKDFTNDKVLHGINSLSDAPGLDILGFDWKLLRMCSNLIAPSLCIIFNNSIENQLLHRDFKTARVTPIYKNGDDCDINVYSDYRPISVMCYIAKILERLVKDQLIEFIENNNIISQDQSAYLRGQSTQTSLHIG